LRPVRLIDGREVERTLDYPSLIARLRAGFRAGCESPLRHRHELPAAGGGAIMLLKPAWRRGGPIVVKLINVFPGNGARGLPAVMGCVVMFDGGTGETVAVIDGRVLTIRRTAAASALAADYLAAPDSRVLAIVGTGQLAPELARAHATVRPIEHILVWGRSAEKAAHVAAGLAADGVRAEPAASLRAAVEAADIVSCATLASEPLVRGAWLRPGAHLDLVGSFTPTMREADDEALRLSRVFVDTREGALAEAGEIVQACANGVLSAADIAGELADLCRGGVAGRRHPLERTLFKSVGTALEDLVAAELAFERATPDARAANGAVA
jgi:ornithine cyclodeaminase